MVSPLVIDDNKMMRLYLQRCLEEAVFEVEGWVPESALEVLEHLEASAPDLILSEDQMAGCNALAVWILEPRRLRPFSLFS